MPARQTKGGLIVPDRFLTASILGEPAPPPAEPHKVTVVRFKPKAGVRWWQAQCETEGCDWKSMHYRSEAIATKEGRKHRRESARGRA